MSKRRRTSSIASRGQEDDTISVDSFETASSGGPSRPKRSKKQQDPTEIVQQLYDSIRNHKKDDGSLLCDSFIRVPKRRQEPGYYEVVTNPIDLLKVQQKLKTDEYEDAEDLQADIELIVKNAKAFYKKNSQEFKDANELWELFLANRARLEGKDEEADTKSKILMRVVGRSASKKSTPTPEPTPKNKVVDIDLSEDTSESSTNVDEDYSPYEDLFTAVMTATDSDNRPLHTEFQLLPSKKKYPRYYEVIESPIDLKTIATKIQNNEYTNLNDIEKDLNLMTKNACTFNEPGSLIYRNAKALKKIVLSKKLEIEHSKAGTSKSSERIRNKKPKPVQSLSAVTAALRDEESEVDIDPDESMEEEASDVVDSENPQWQLFEAVRTVANNNGTLLSEPFWRLPSRRFYPDYFREIKNPVSLTQIKKKLSLNAYGTVSEVAGDLNIMFENAKKYNVPTSKLYKDAVRLQKVMQSKVQELLDLDQVTQIPTNKHRKDEPEADSDVPPRKKPGPKPRNPQSVTPSRGRPPLKKRLQLIAKHLLDFTVEDGRKPMLAFMEKPSKKLYPDYYEVIAEPIDFLEIENKIRNDQYNNEAEFVKQFKLMFNNCRQYNEENSTIVEDANLLEKLLSEKVTQHAPTPEKKSVPRVSKPRKTVSPIEKKCRTLYDAIRDYRDPKANRQLSLIFMKLPSKLDYPDYYEVIKNPIDMEKISHKLKCNFYETLDDLVSDFVLMFDNACKYNEPDSQIYKDALSLQRVCLQTKLQLKEDDDTVPDVPAAVQDLLLNLFTNVYNHQDSDERCYSDSMADLPEHDEIDGKKVRAVSLDLIKRRLDRGVYKRLDTFQEDMFQCLERARRISRSDSQVFEDSVELQTYFIKQRDELCKNGDVLFSPALNYSLMHLTAAVESQRQNKILQESVEDESETRSSDDSMMKDNVSNSSGGDSMTCNQKTYKVGDFVYIDAKEKGCDPHILLIERLWTNSGQQMLYGNYYLRPIETFHVTTRKFLEKEVFKSDTHIAVPLEEVKDRCCVMNVKQYLTMKPEGFEEKDIYVCESRYSTRQRSFKKIKIYPETANLTLVPREVPLEPKRVMSVFRERVEKHKDELAELQESEKLIEKEKPNVVTYVNMDIDDGNTYYEQYNTLCSGVIKTGDFVYVATDGGRQLIAQVDTIWDTKDGKSYFRGPWFVTPSDIPNVSPKMFYKQEVFLSSIEDTNPIVSIVGKCAVLDFNDYVSSRPTEVLESDVYICISMYDEINKQIRKLPHLGMKKYTHSNAVTEDEIYYFPKLITPVKVSGEPQKAELKRETGVIMDVKPNFQEPSTSIKMDMDMIMEDSLDGGPPSVGSGDIPATVIQTPTVVTPVTSKKKNIKNKVVTGYILYSREVRKRIVQNNPESNFGEISKIVGNEWRSLAANEKLMWEEKASKLNEETKAQLLDEQCSSPAPAANPDLIYECLWDNCDFQFEEVSDCIEHCVKDKESQGHIQAYFQANPDTDFNCHWKNCLRNNKKNCQPFPNLARLVRHVRDMHINKGNGRVVPPDNRSKNFKPSSKTPAVVRPPTTATPTPRKSAIVTSSTLNTPGNLATTTTTAAPTPPVVPAVKQPEPLFITVPPRPQRVLHSEAYIKYIEGLNVENKFISNWERNLNATAENTPAPDTEKLQTVTAWLGKKANQHENVLNALWSLRNQLLQDTLGIQKNL